MPNIALTVDDDQHTLLFLQQVLAPLHFEVIQAEDGAQAIQVLETVTPNVLFLDMLLPEVSGVDVLAFVRETPRLNNMYVVVLSAHNRFQGNDSMDRADVYLVKPVRLKVLRDTIQQAISHPISR